jgi:hypothetical protein
VSPSKQRRQISCGVALLESRMDAIESPERSSRWSSSTVLGATIGLKSNRSIGVPQFAPIEGHTRPFGRSCCGSNRSNLFVELVDTPTDNKRARCFATALHARAVAMSSNWLRWI